jgi:type IV secretory pathway TrbL component
MEWITAAGDWVNTGLFGSPVGGVASIAMDAQIIDKMASQFVDQINSLGGILPAKFHLLYFAFAVIAFVTALGKMMYFRSVKPVADFGIFYAFLMVLLVVSANWNMASEGWAGWMSRTAFQSLGYDFSYMAPSVVLAEGFRIIKALYDSGISFYRIFLGSSDDSIAGLILLLALGGLAWAVIQMVAVLVVMLVFFKLSSLLALCLLPFLLLGQTRFMAAPGVVRIIQYGLQFFVVGLLIGLTFRFISGWTFSERPDANEVLSFAIAVGVLSILMKHGMNIAKEHIAGSPITAGREGASALSEGVGSLNRSVNQLTRAMVSHSRTVGHGGGVGGMVANAVRSGFRSAGGGPANSSGSRGPGGPGAWAAEPTKKQHAVASRMGVDLSGQNRAQASATLEKAGMDPTWAKDSASGQSALGGAAPEWAKRAASRNSGGDKI